MIGVNVGRLFNPASIHGSGAAPSSLLTGLLSYYKFDENTGSTVADSAGTNTGTWNSSGWTPGIINSGGSFGGANYVDIGNHLAFERTNPFSVSFWEKTASKSEMQVIGKISTLDYATVGWSVVYSNNLYLILNAGASFGTNMIQVNGDSAGAATNGNWHHQIVTYDGSSAASGIKFYHDGSLLTTLTDSNTLSATIVNAQSCRIGAVTSGANFFNGVIDEVGIWSRVLTSAEVTTLYNSGAGRQYPF